MSWAVGLRHGVSQQLGVWMPENARFAYGLSLNTIQQSAKRSVHDTTDQKITSLRPLHTTVAMRPSRQLPRGRARLRDLSDALRLLHPQHLRTREATQELGHRHLASQSWTDKPRNFYWRRPCPFFPRILVLRKP